MYATELRIATVSDILLRYKYIHIETTPDFYVIEVFLGSLEFSFTDL